MVIATVTLLVLSVPSSAATITIDTTDDAEVRSANPTTNFGSDNLYAGASGGSLNRIPYLKFSLSSVPSGQTIDAVKLYLYYWASPQQTTDTVDIYKSSNTSWSEDTLTWDGQTSWTHTLAESDTVPMTGGASGWKDWDLTSSMFSQGETVTLQVRASGDYTTRFQDSEHGSTPYLEVTYTPEPATMSLLLLGLPLALRRRRK